MTHERDMRQEWKTPNDFFAVVDAEFHFQIDVCATKDSAKCKVYHSLYDDGIDALKDGASWIIPEEDIYHAWCNPGFTRPGPWMKKAYWEAQKHEDALVVVLGLIGPSTRWWRDWALRAHEIRLIGGRRLQFKPPPGVNPSSNARENCIIIFRKDLDLKMQTETWTWDWNRQTKTETLES